MQPDYTTMIRIGEVCRRTGLSKSQIHRLISNATFPSSVKLGLRAAAWVERDVEKWLQDQISASHTGSPT